MSTDNRHYRDILLGAIIGVPAFVLLVVLMLGVISVLQGRVDTASDYAGFASGLATVVLVGVTFWYAKGTQDLVEESRRDREARERLHEESRREKAQGLRRAIGNEIAAISNYDEIADWPIEALLSHRSWGPKKVYSNNTTNLHLLSQEEILIITEYYNHLHFLESLNRRARSHSNPEDVSEEFEARLREVIKSLRGLQEDAVENIVRNLPEDEPHFKSELEE